MEPVTLKRNHQQGEGSRWTETLNRLRVGEPTEEDIELLKSRCITQLNKHYPHEALHMYYTNKDVASYNNLRLNNLRANLKHAELVGDFPKG